MKNSRSWFLACFRSPLGATALVLTIVLVVVSAVGSAVFGDQAVHLDAAAAGQGASSQHVLGTDALGRDILARTLAATGLTLGLTMLAVVIAFVIGVPLGASVAILPPRLRRVVGAVIQFSLSFPSFLIALCLVTVIGSGALNASIAVGLALIPSFARVAQTLASSITNSDFLAASRVLGVPAHIRLTRHVLPNCGEPLILVTAAYTTTALFSIASLSFLGLGVQAPAFDWGSMMAQGLQAIFVTPLPALAPGIAIVIAGVTANLMGDALARGMSPALRVAAMAPARRRSGRRSVASRTVLRHDGAPVDDAAVLSIRDLRVSFPHEGTAVPVVRGVDLSIHRGEIVGVVGESGSGKTMLSLAALGLVPHPGEVEAGALRFHDADLLSSRRARGLTTMLATRLAVIFQDATASLNPSVRVGIQVSEKAEVHTGIGRRAGRALAVQRLKEVRITDAAARAHQYPHQFSGGMRQRAMIAASLSTEPDLIIADEPTTALDVTVQAEIVTLLRTINRTHGTAVLFVSHDLALVSELCSRIVVMYAGKIVETLGGEEFVDSALHPYTRALRAASVGLDAPRDRELMAIPGQPPTPAAVTTGCAFAPRCPLAVDRCWSEEPRLVASSPQHSVACWVMADEHQEVAA